MTTATLADWTTPQPFALPDLGPGLVDEQRQALELTLQAIAADGCWWCSPKQLKRTNSHAGGSVAIDIGRRAC